MELKPTQREKFIFWSYFLIALILILYFGRDYFWGTSFNFIKIVGLIILIYFFVRGFTEKDRKNAIEEEKTNL